MSASEAIFTERTICSTYPVLPIRRLLRTARGCRGPILPQASVGGGGNVSVA